VLLEATVKKKMLFFAVVTSIVISSSCAQAQASYAQSCTHAPKTTCSTMPLAVPTAEIQPANTVVDNPGVPQWYYFSTNREYNLDALSVQKRDYDMVYLERSPTNTVSHGRIQITAPVDRPRGQSTALKVRGRPHQISFAISRHEKFDTAATLLSAIGADTKPLAELARRRVLIYIHGVNNVFTSAGYRMAQFGDDVGYVGARYFFSWPSKSWGKVEIDMRNTYPKAPWYYPQDSAELDYSYNFLRDQIFDFVATDELHIDVIAHSRGSSAIARIIENLNSEQLSRINNVVFAAADHDVRLFERDTVPKFPRISGRVTSFVRRDDEALKWSASLTNTNRVGMVAQGFGLYIDTIDVVGDLLVR
jgi:esterase/lipase superfamily enzyme